MGMCWHPKILEWKSLWLKFSLHRGSDSTTKHTHTHITHMNAPLHLKFRSTQTFNQMDLWGKFGQESTNQAPYKLWRRLPLTVIFEASDLRHLLLNAFGAIKPGTAKGTQLREQFPWEKEWERPAAGRSFRDEMLVEKSVSFSWSAFSPLDVGWGFTAPRQSWKLN